MWSPLAPGHLQGGWSRGCALPGLRELLTSWCWGCVTGWEQQTRGSAGRQGWGGVSGDRDRPGTCLPGCLLIGAARGESGEILSVGSELAGLSESPGCASRLSPPPTSRAWLLFPCLDLLKNISPRKEGWKKAACNWAWVMLVRGGLGWSPGGKATVSITVFHGERKGL